MLISGLSALYARWATNEAKKSNDIGRLNSLLALRTHYLQLIEHQLKIAKLMPDGSTGIDIAEATCANIEEKLKEVNLQINNYHNKVVENKI